MQQETIYTLLQQHFTNCQVSVELEGNSANIQIIGEIFAGLNKVKRQQMVYKAIGNLITDGCLHAVSINTYTTAEIGN
jgi:acid stress-induced BolA-like protein IbaG/YrbA